MKTEITLADLQKLKAGIGAPVGGALAMSAMTLAQTLINRIESTASHERHKWNAYCGHFGGQASDYGAIVVVQGRRFEIIGINPGAPRFPIQGKRLPDGKVFRLTKDVLRTIVRPSTTKGGVMAEQNAHTDDVKDGDVLIADGGFTCIAENAELVVGRDDFGQFVPCDDGKHHLSGQRDERGYYIGLRRKAEG